MKPDRLSRYLSRRTTNRLKSLISYAYEQVPAYRHKFDQAGVHPGNIQALTDINRLPLLSKDELRAAFPDNILARKFRNRHPVTVSTGGHTGMPVRLYRDKKQLDNAARGLALFSGFIPRLVKFWTGLQVGKRISLVYPVDMDYDIYLIMKKTLEAPRFLSSFLQYVDSAQEPVSQLKAIAAHRPDILATDPNTLCNLAIVSRKYNVKPYRPSLLFIGEEFMEEMVRDIVTRTFSENYIEHYGAEEVGTIGISCLKHAGFHLLPTVIVEILKDGQPVPPETQGDIVVTDLTNMVSPIIRYTGLRDIGTISNNRCECGSRLPRLMLQEGRVRDSLLLPDMLMVHPRSIVAAFKNISGVVDYQVEQESEDRIKVSIVADESVTHAADSQEKQSTLLKTVSANVGRLVGDKVQLEIVLVDAITEHERLLIHPNVHSKVRQRAIDAF